MSDFEDQMIELEQSVREKYHMDPVFHAKVHMGANVIMANMHVEGEAERRDALRTALIILAIGEEDAAALQRRHDKANAFAEANLLPHIKHLQALASSVPVVHAYGAAGFTACGMETGGPISRHDGYTGPQLETTTNARRVTCLFCKLE